MAYEVDTTGHSKEWFDVYVGLDQRCFMELPHQAPASKSMTGALSNFLLLIQLHDQLEYR